MLQVGHPVAALPCPGLLAVPLSTPAAANQLSAQQQVAQTTKAGNPRQGLTLWDCVQKASKGVLQQIRCRYMIPSSCET